MTPNNTTNSAILVTIVFNLILVMAFMIPAVVNR